MLPFPAVPFIKSVVDTFQNCIQGNTGIFQLSMSAQSSGEKEQARSPRTLEMLFDFSEVVEVILSPVGLVSLLRIGCSTHAAR